MDTDAVLAFLAERRNAVVAGIRTDGRPSLTPNWFVFDGERFYVSTMRSRAKYGMFRRDDRVQLLIDDSTGHRYVRLDGKAELWEDLDQIAPIVRRIREKYGRSTGDDAALRENLIAEDRVVLVVQPNQPLERWLLVGF